jgi:hypothetical protein
MRLVLAAALLALSATAAVAANPPALSPADANRDGVVSKDEAADWMARSEQSIIPIRMDRATRAQVAGSRQANLNQGLLRPNDFRAPAPEDRPAEDLFYKDFKKLKK